MTDNKPAYTTEIHVARLEVMLELGDPCNMCPASVNFSAGGLGPEYQWDSYPLPCQICREFVDATDRQVEGCWCPCSKLGKNEALRRTYLAIEEYKGGRHER